MPINKLQGKRWISWWQHWVVNIQLENTYSTGFEHQNLMITFWFTECKMMNRTVGGYKLFLRTHRIFKTIDHSQSKQSGNWSVQSEPMSKVLLGHSHHYLLACCGGCFQPSSSGTFTSFEITVLGPKVCCWSQMGGHWVPEILLPTLPQGWDYNCILLCLSLFTMWIFGVKLRSF